MKKNRHFYYDPDRCEFIPVSEDRNNKLLHSFTFWLVNSIVVATVGLTILANTVGSPAEIALKAENKALLDQLKKAESSMTSIEEQLEAITELDNELYRSVLGLELSLKKRDKLVPVVQIFMKNSIITVLMHQKFCEVRLLNSIILNDDWEFKNYP